MPPFVVVDFSLFYKVGGLKDPNFQDVVKCMLYLISEKKNTEIYKQETTIKLYNFCKRFKNK